MLFELAELQRTMTVQMNDLVSGQKVAFEAYEASDSAYRKELNLYSSREDMRTKAGIIHAIFCCAGAACIHRLSSFPKKCMLLTLPKRLAEVAQPKFL